MMKLKSDERDLVGGELFLKKEKKIINDPISDRIEYLIEHCLTKIKSDKTGWNILYIDPEDGRYWELTFPKGYLQGGGPPRLTVISKETAEQKYKIEPTK